MRKMRLLITLTCGLSLVLAVLWIVKVQSYSVSAAPPVGPANISSMPVKELRVCPNGCAYASVQEAVDAADEGDIIKVATGIYTGVNNYAGLAQVVYLSKTLTIQGGYTTADWTKPAPEIYPTTLDAQNQGRVFYVIGDIHPTIAGLRITGGEAQGLGGIPDQSEWDLGGGVLVITATAEITNNQVLSNTCSSDLSNGGGIALLYSDAIIESNTFRHNSTGWGGGGLWAGWSNSKIVSNLFSSNQARDGGGVELYMDDGTFSENLVISNAAEFGGGFSTHIGKEKVVNNVFADNIVSNSGGGLSINGSSAQLLHNTIARNSGGDGSGIMIIQSFFGPYSVVDLTNTILVDHEVGISVTGGNTVTVNAILWDSTPITVSKSITAIINLENEHIGDPVFSSDGYHLSVGSEAIDRGVDSEILMDIDGELRPAGTAYDLGADELWYRIYLPVITNKYP